MCQTPFFVATTTSAHSIAYLLLDGTHSRSGILLMAEIMRMYHRSHP